MLYVVQTWDGKRWVESDRTDLWKLANLLMRWREHQGRITRIVAFRATEERWTLV